MSKASKVFHGYMHYATIQTWYRHLPAVTQLAPSPCTAFSYSVNHIEHESGAGPVGTVHTWRKQRSSIYRHVHKRLYVYRCQYVQQFNGKRTSRIQRETDACMCHTKKVRKTRNKKKEKQVLMDKLAYSEKCYYYNVSFSAFFILIQFLYDTCVHSLPFKFRAFFNKLLHIVVHSPKFSSRICV